MKRLQILVANLVEKGIDFVFSLWPQKRPERARAESTKLVAHRGAHEYGVKENTLRGFELCIQHQIWGIEFDVRWTKDHEPVLLHDDNAGHVFGRPDIVPAQMTLPVLKKEIPTIPTLAEVVQKFAGKIHFMIELKECFFSHSGQIKRLMEILKPLRPIRDYHLMSLQPEALLAISQVPKAVLIGISFLNTKKIAEVVKTHSLGGHCGHYLLLNRNIQNQHVAKGQKTGVGYVASRKSLYREINRDLTWLFTNQPFEMQEIINELTKKQL